MSSKDNNLNNNLREVTITDTNYHNHINNVIMTQSELDKAKKKFSRRFVFEDYDLSVETMKELIARNILTED